MADDGLAVERGVGNSLKFRRQLKHPSSIPHTTTDTPAAESAPAHQRIFRRRSCIGVESQVTRLCKPVLKRNRAHLCRNASMLNLPAVTLWRAPPQNLPSHAHASSKPIGAAPQAISVAFLRAARGQKRSHRCRWQRPLSERTTLSRCSRRCQCSRSRRSFFIRWSQASARSSTTKGQMEDSVGRHSLNQSPLNGLKYIALWRAIAKDERIVTLSFANQYYESGAIASYR